MRVIEPHHLKGVKKSKESKRTPISKLVIALIVLVPLVALGSYIYFYIYPGPEEVAVNEDLNQLQFTPPASDPLDVSEKPLKKLKGEEFRDLYQSIVYPNTTETVDPPIITGNDFVDDRIRELAEARGYRRTSVPQQAIVRIEDEPRLDSDDLLQPLAAEAWSNLKKAATDAGYPVSLLSAYRSTDYQRRIFLNRLYARVAQDELERGLGDAAIEATLETTALPGYSRHHTGYTIDLWCDDGSTAFVNSICYDWISDENYENAMTYGWIPSYPDKTDLQGPEPEPWEYVWVGDAVRES